MWREIEREKRETFLCSKPLNYYSAVIAFASEGYTNTKKKKKNFDNSTLKSTSN